MSMIQHYMQISPALLEKIKGGQTATPHDPKDTTYLVLYPKEGPEPKDLYEGSEPELDIDKTWHYLNWLLTGRVDLESHEGNDNYVKTDAPAIQKVVLGGVAIGKDIGYGPARYLTPEEVKQVADALEPITKDELKSKWDKIAISKIREEMYPVLSPEQIEDPTMVDFFLQFFDQLKVYFKDAASKGNVMLLWCS